MSSQSSRALESPQVPMDVVIVMLDGLQERYSLLAERVGGVYPALAATIQKAREALVGTNPIGELRTLAWRTPYDAVSEVAEAAALMLETHGGAR